MKTLLSKKIEILDAAETIIQLRGYNGFSFADISEKVGIRKASIHHHFPSKTILGVSVVRRYCAAFNEALMELERQKISWINKIERYTDLYKTVLLQNKLCLCGMLATDMETLPKILKKEIREFFNDNIEWLTSILKKQFPSKSNQNLNAISYHIISSLQGGIIFARAQDQPEIFTSTCLELIQHLKTI